MEKEDMEKMEENTFSWLRNHNWTSRIGGSSVTWRAPGIPGLRGIYKSDEESRDLYAIKAEMVASLNSMTPQNRD